MPCLIYTAAPHASYIVSESMEQIAAGFAGAPEGDIAFVRLTRLAEPHEPSKLMLNVMEIVSIEELNDEQMAANMKGAAQNWARLVEETEDPQHERRSKP